MQTATAPTNHSELRERVLDYLADHTVLNLATYGPAGLWAAQVLYVHEGIDLYFTSVATTRHGINMSSTGRIAGTISDECLEWLAMKGIQLEGCVERVGDLEQRRRVVRAYLRRFPFASGLWHGSSDVEAIALDPGVHHFYRVTPTRLLFTDNEHAPAGREELAM
jgi:uncharacterized protein YhbP (UPF0306 family)